MPHQLRVGIMAMGTEENELVVKLRREWSVGPSSLRGRSPTNGSALIAFPNIRPLVLPPCEKTSKVCESLRRSGCAVVQRRLPVIGGPGQGLVPGAPLAMASSTRFP